MFATRLQENCVTFAASKPEGFAARNCVFLSIQQNYKIMAHKTLTRSVSDSKIAGICGGLGNYFDLDSNVFRILFVLMLFCGSMGFWFYLICWIILPVDNNVLNP